MKQRTHPTKAQAQKWANALRSGKYKQTTAVLQDRRGHCCLGVACDLFIPKNKLIKMELDGAAWIMSGGLPDHQANAPYWLKEVNDDASIRTGRSLSGMNDDGASFDEIADVIELLYVHNAVPIEEG